MSVETSWDRIEIWLAANFPEGLRNLNKGTSTEAIEEAEASLGFELPSSMRESYLRHDGERRWETHGGLVYGFDLYPLSDVVQEAEEALFYIEQEDLGVATGSILPGFWNRGWIPFVDDGGGNNLAIDLCPVEGQPTGRIINGGERYGQCSVRSIAG